MSVKRTLLVCLSVTIALTSGGCGERGEVSWTESHLRGVVTVRPAVDSVKDYRGFEVLIASADGLADTLGLALTDSAGSFEMDVRAPEKGIYPLMIRRRGALLKRGQIVLAHGDSATLNVRLPDGNRPLIIRSKENAAWLAYRNTRHMHNRELLALVQSGAVGSADQSRRFVQTSELLWRLKDQFPGTIGAEIAGAESALLLEGINDSLMVRRAVLLNPDSPAFVDVARGLRRSKSRLRGLDAAISLLDSLTGIALKPERKAAIASEVVLALVDSGRVEEAADRATDMKARYAETEWATWANEAVFELQNVMPGMEAPGFVARTWGGDAYVFDPARSGTVLLEFFRPVGDAFIREMDDRDSLATVLASAGVTFVAVSVEPDSILNEAFFESRDRSDVQIALADGLQDPIAISYNVKVVPKRILITDGRIVSKYTGTAALSSIGRDVIAMESLPPS